MNKDYKCRIENCPNKVHAKGYCRVHYGRWWRTGKALPQQPARVLKRLTEFDLNEVQHKIEKAKEAYACCVGLDARLRWSRRIADLKREYQLMAEKIKPSRAAPRAPSPDPSPVQTDAATVAN